MDFDLNEDQRMLRDTVERYVKEQCGFETRRHLLTQADSGAVAHWSDFADMGWLAIGVPEEFDGLGLSSVEMALVAEQMGRGLLLDPFIPTAVTCTQILVNARDYGLREKMLRSIAAGESRLALAHTPAGQGFPSSVRRTSNGASLTIRKQMVIGGTVCDHFIVSVQDDLGGESSLWLVPQAEAASGIHGYALLDGTRACDLHLEELELSDEYCIARGDQATSLLACALDHTRVAMLAEALGGQAACLDLCAEHVKAREQFGQPIGKFQAVQHMMAESFVDYQSARSMLYRALAFLNATPQKRSLAVSSAKLVVTKAGRAISKTSVQLHGACGFTDEYAVSHHYRKQVVLGGLFGDEAFHAAQLANAADNPS